MSRKNTVKIFKLILTMVVIVICIGIIIYLFPVMKNLSTPDGQEVFKKKVDSSGFIGMLSLFGLQVAQIFLIIIPFVIIAFGIFDIYKAIVNQGDKSLNKSIVKLVYRVIACLLIFFLPSLIFLVFKSGIFL